MSGHYITTTIGNEVTVVVYFDYQPEEKQTHTDPGVASSATVEAVYLFGEESFDIIDVLSNTTISRLEEECLTELEATEEDGR